MAGKRKLTEKQEKFLAVLFEEAGGDFVRAKELAGYSPTVSTTSIINSMKDEVMEQTHMYLARNAPRAAVAMVGAIIDPTTLGIKERMTAAKEIMDRVGIVKTEKMQVEAMGGVMLLPPKKPSNED